MASLGARDRQALLVENFVPEKRSTLSIPLKGDVSPVRVLAAHREGFLRIARKRTNWSPFTSQNGFPEVLERREISGRSLPG
ncbi:hypothetical protein NKI32_28730 [Mesorhizobium sp. M0761]|uniref:hypothetical protein n=1 Tax=unclassified Mesorhizobium TaxID=325217 RepID=UPI003337D685